jgi:diguanylate cyclase (GGDEF)-like protein/PAS domain S-box-containing protein
MWRAWSLLAVGAGAWALGQVGWSVYEVGLGVVPPTPSWLDGLFLLSPLLVIAGLLAMVKTPAGRLSQLRGVLEGLLIAGGFFLCSWVLVIEPVAAASSSPFLEQAVNLAYPVLDAVGLAAVLFVALRRRGDRTPGLGLLALGIVCVAASDMSFWYLSATNAQFPGVTPLDTGWVAGFVVIAFAARGFHSKPRDTGRVMRGRLVLALPALPATVGVAVAVVNWLSGSEHSPLVVLITIGLLLVAAVALQLVVVYENHALTSDLEHRVEERTAELYATERYYRALVQHSSDVVMVVDLDHTIRWVSDSVVDILGRSPAVLIGSPLQALGADAERALAQTLTAATVAPAKTARVRWHVDDDTGRTHHAESTITNMLADPNVAAFVLNTRDVTDNVALETQLRHQAFHDPLTGLANRALLSDRAEVAFARSLRTGGLVALIVVDLDAFKWVNDTHGHQAADDVLLDVAQRLDTEVRPEDTVARFGGDEFVVLIDSVSSADEACAIAERVHGALQAPFTIAGTDQAVTASAGVAVASAAQADFDRLLADADLAMYAIKAAGKNAVQLFEPSMHDQARERFRLQGELRRAIEAEEFWILYQPLFDTSNIRLVGFEALVRWNHPRRGLLRPDAFIPLATGNRTQRPPRDRKPVDDRRQRLSPAAGCSRLRVRSRAGDGGRRHRAESGHDRDHRERADRGLGRDDCRVAHAQAARCQDRDRRFWYRLRVALLPAAHARRHAQGRPQLYRIKRERSHARAAQGNPPNGRDAVARDARRGR